MTVDEAPPPATTRRAPLTLADIERCFEGAVPAVMATASADGVPNVIYVSRAHAVDDERIALSNQFLSKTARNIAANPRASLLLIDPLTHDEFRLTLVYERTERRGHVFERLRADVDALAALEGMQDVFRLRAADIYRVLDIEQIPPNSTGVRPTLVPDVRRSNPDLAALAELARRLGRCGGIDALVDCALVGLDQLFGYRHSHLLLLDEEGRRLYTIASRGFDADSMGAEVEVGVGLVGMAAARCQPMRVGNMQQVAKYSRSVRAQYEQAGGTAPSPGLAVPGLPNAESRVAAPVQALGELVGVLMVESPDAVAYGPGDDDVLTVVGSLLGNALEHLRALERDGDDSTAPSDTRSGVAPTSPPATSAPTVLVRHFDVDGSTFLDGEYLIRGVAGRILWALLRSHTADGRVEFTNKELRLDPTLDLPGFKDNLESRLILLKRRLDERDAPVRIEKTGRGRFRLDVAVPVALDEVPAP